MRWFAPEDQPALPVKTASTRKTASIREVYKGSDKNVADALARLEGEHSKVRVMRGPDRKPIPAAVNIWNSAKRALTDLALMLGGGEAASGEGVTQQPEQTTVPTEAPSSYLANSRRQFKTAGAPAQCQNCDEYVKPSEIDDTGLCETCQKKQELEARTDGHWVKTAGEMVQCGNCDRHVDEDEIDATGKCSTCQEEHDTMEHQEVEKLN